MTSADQPHDHDFDLDDYANDFLDAGEDRLLADDLAREDYGRIADLQLLDTLLTHLLHPEPARTERCVQRVIEAIKSETPDEASPTPILDAGCHEVDTEEDVEPLLELISAILESPPPPPVSASVPTPAPEPQEYGLPAVPLLRPLGGTLRRWTQIGVVQYLAWASLVLFVSFVVQWMWEDKPAASPEMAHSVPSAMASFEELRPVGVGQITGMKACQWAEGATRAGFYDRVRIGQKFHLETGLLELTYDTGFKAILQGPVKYEVTSANGGFLSLGRLTGQATTERARGFAVDTPTASVTDLGTEFGAEVAPDGRMETVVFSGEVKLVATTPQGKMGTGQLLRAGEAAQVIHDQSNRDDSGGGELGWFPKIIAMAIARQERFTRTMPPVPVKVLIDPTQLNGSFEEPAVGPAFCDAEASDPKSEVYAKTRDIAAPFWNRPYALRTKGTAVRGVTGEQYAVVQGAISVFSTRFDGQTGHPPASNFTSNTVYVLTADIGSNVPGARGRVAFGAGTHSKSYAVSFSVSERNAMEPIIALSLNTSLHPELVGQPISVSFVNMESSPTSLLYVDNVVLRAFPVLP
jgi:hypothetical protein